MRHALLLLLSISLSAAEDRAISAKAVLEPAKALYRSQLLGDLDHAVGDKLVIAGLNIACKRNAKGDLELDLAGDGKFRAYSTSKLVPISVEVPAGEGKKAATVKLSLFFERHPDNTWTYRNACQLTISLGEERLVVVDVDGDGAFNKPGVDGMTWADHAWLFPLPAASERFCTGTLDLTGLALGKLGEELTLKGRPISTTLANVLPVLLGVNRERVKLGLSPRPEDPRLSADLQKHCAYMTANGALAHPEEVGKPGYSPEGHNSGMRSILSQGTPPDRIAAVMVGTYFHRQDVIRPETIAFGVGYDGRFGGIDGRASLAPTAGFRWPIICPVPDQMDIPLTYGKESPDAVPGDDQAGYPITAFFGTGSPTLVSYQLTAASAPKVPIDCYPFDHKTGASASFSSWQHVVCLMAKDPLQADTQYEVNMVVDHQGKRWERTWRFTTGNRGTARGRSGSGSGNGAGNGSDKGAGKGNGGGKK